MPMNTNDNEYTNVQLFTLYSYNELGKEINTKQKYICSDTATAKKIAEYLQNQLQKDIWYRISCIYKDESNYGPHMHLNTEEGVEVFEKGMSDGENNDKDIKLEPKTTLTASLKYAEERSAVVRVYDEDGREVLKNTVYHSKPESYSFETEKGQKYIVVYTSNLFNGKTRLIKGTDYTVSAGRIIGGKVMSIAVIETNRFQ